MSGLSGGAAFPGGVNSVYSHIDEGEPTQSGMTYRQWLIGMALQGTASVQLSFSSVAMIVDNAEAIADAAIAKQSGADNA